MKTRLRFYPGSRLAELDALHKREVRVGGSVDVGKAIEGFGAISSRDKKVIRPVRLFHGQVHPEIDGYKWQEVLFVPFPAGSALICVPWKMSDYNKGYKIFLDGFVSDENIDPVLRKLISEGNRQLDEQQASLKTERLELKGLRRERFLGASR